MNNIIPISEQEKQSRISEFVAKFELEYLIFDMISKLNQLHGKLGKVSSNKKETSEVLALIKTGNDSIEELMKIAFETKQSAFIYEIGDN